jgi:hypothetical protein
MRTRRAEKGSGECDTPLARSVSEIAVHVNYPQRLSAYLQTTTAVAIEKREHQTVRPESKAFGSALKSLQERDQIRFLLVRQV